MAGSTEDRIRRLEARRYEAMVKPDLPALHMICADDLTYTHSNGVQDSKSEYLEKIASGSLKYVWAEHAVDRVIDEGFVAVILGRMSAEVTVDGDTRRLNSLSLAVWAYRATGWQLVAYQPTPVK